MNDVHIALVGVNHRTAPVEIREKFNLAVACLHRSTFGDVRLNSLSEIAVVSTCNRLELYFVFTGSVSGTEEGVVKWLADAAGLSLVEAGPLFYRESGREAIRHLLRVACGLDSQILGETQILGQISRSFVAAREEATVGPLLTFALSRAVYAGKRARTETSIAQGGTSISHAAASLVAKELGCLSDKRVVIIGAGETAEKALQALRKRGEPQVACVTRSMTQTHAPCAMAGCEMLPWSALSQTVATADAVISATSAPHVILYAEDIAPILGQRGDRPLVLVDIAVPRDIDPLVGALPSVVLYDIDLLEASLDQSRARREAAVPKVEGIVSEETENVMEWLHGRQVAPLIRELQARAKAVADAEARRAVGRMDDLSARQQDAVFQMARRIARKILHEPTVRLRTRAKESDGQRHIEAFKDMLGLDSEAIR